MGKRKKKSGYWVYQYLTNSTNKWNAVLSLFKILSLSISRFETRTRILFSKSQSSRQEQDFCSLNLRVRDENEIFFWTSQSSRRERDIFFQSLEVEREKMNLNLTRSREIERSRYALVSAVPHMIDILKSEPKLYNPKAFWAVAYS